MSNESRAEERAFLDRLRPFAVEDRARSWVALGSTLALLGGALGAAAALPWWPLRVAASVVAGLLVVRGFILYHDFMHGALLRGSPAARALFYAYGVLVLTPPRVWRQTHNYHHAHTAKIVGSHVGSYAVVTTDMWRRMTPRERFAYRVVRHPLTILFGYGTIFLYGMCASSFVRSPRRNWDSAVALVVHAALVALLWTAGGPDVLVLAFLLPLFIACALGGYLFYAQHNFEGVHIQPRERWSYVRAALESSSYMELGPVLRWLTGNIGYHHVHHLLPTIPFYRLPEAMTAIPELRAARVTTLRPRDVLACLRLKLWNPELGRMVGYPRD